MLDKIIFTGAELARAFSVDYATSRELEAMTDALPYFTIPGHNEHFYPVEAVSAWAARQCEQVQR